MEERFYSKNMQTNDIASTVVSLAASLCRYPEQLRTQTMHGTITVLTLTPHRADYGAVNGARGRTITALKEISKELAERQGTKMEVLLKEGDVGVRQSRSKFVANKLWTPDRLEEKLLPLLRDLFPGRFVFEYEEVQCANNDSTKMSVVITGRTPPRPLADALGQLAKCWAGLDGQELVFQIVGDGNV